MIKAVLIDIDNTLLDFDASVREAMKSGFEQFKLGTYRDSMFDIFERINTRLWQEIEQGTLTFDGLMKRRWNEVFSVLGISFDGCRFETFFRSYLYDSAIPVKGAAELLAYLKKSYIVCAASNGPYKQQINRLKNADMLQYFSNFFISEKIGFSKPSTEFFSCCLSELGSEILPHEVIMIGDSLTSDIAGAIQSGLKTCYFDENANGKTLNTPIDYTVNSLNDIRNFL